MKAVACSAVYRREKISFFHSIAVAVKFELGVNGGSRWFLC